MFTLWTTKSYFFITGTVFWVDLGILGLILASLAGLAGFGPPAGYASRTPPFAIELKRIDS